MEQNLTFIHNVIRPKEAKNTFRILVEKPLEKFPSGKQEEVGGNIKMVLGRQVTRMEDGWNCLRI